MNLLEVHESTGNKRLDLATEGKAVATSPIALRTQAR